MARSRVLPVEQTMIYRDIACDGLLAHCVLMSPSMKRTEARMLATLVGPTTMGAMVPLIRARIVALANLKTLCAK